MHDTFILQFTWKNKYVIIVKQLDKDHALLIFKTHYKADVIKSYGIGTETEKKDYLKGTSCLETAPDIHGTY